jgi:hypothetical protein
MPYARRSISTNNNRTTKRRKNLGKRRNNDMAKMRYGRTSAKAQQGYILRNARLVNKLNSHYQQSKVFCDWLWSVNPTVDPVTTGNWLRLPMTDLSLYDQTMRQNVTVLAANHTFIKRMSISCQAALGDSPSLFYNCFLVRPRYPSANRDFLLTGLQSGIDYVENQYNPGEMIQLNPSTFKVIAKKQFRLYTNIPSAAQNPDTNMTVGDVGHCVRRWVWNFNVNMKVSNPSNVGQGNWKSVPFDSLPYYNKIYLLVYVRPSDATAGDAVPFGCFSKFTTINVE